MSLIYFSHNDSLASLSSVLLSALSLTSTLHQGRATANPEPGWDECLELTKIFWMS